MKPSRVIVVQTYDKITGLTKNTYLVDEKALKAIDEWIARNKPRMPAPSDIGMVMPELVIYITEDGDLDAATTEIIDVYSELDSKGTIAIPPEEINALIQILTDWGKEKLD